MPAAGMPSSRNGPVSGRYQVVTGTASTTRTSCGRSALGSAASARVRSRDWSFAERPSVTAPTAIWCSAPRGADAVCDGHLDARQHAERVPDRPRVNGTVLRLDHVAEAVDPPEVAVGVAAEQVAGLDPRVATPEHAA